MSGQEDPLEVLVPSLTAHNVHVVAKLADKIPMKVCSCTLSVMTIIQCVCVCVCVCVCAWIACVHVSVAWQS